MAGSSSTRERLTKLTVQINELFLTAGPAIFDDSRTEFAYRNVAVLSDRMDSGHQMNVIADHHMRTLRRLEERTKDLIDCTGHTHPLHKLQRVVSDGQVLRHQRSEAAEILVAGNNLLISMTVTREVNDDILDYFISNAEAAYAMAKGR
jgi:hypothetical protein